MRQSKLRQGRRHILAPLKFAYVANLFFFWLPDDAFNGVFFPFFPEKKKISRYEIHSNHGRRRLKRFFR